jgi:MFS family permease
MTIFFIMTAIAGALLPILAPFNNRQAQRRFFWTGLLIATVSAFLVAYPPDWKSGIGLSLFAAFIMLTNAYFSTSNIKICGKIYAFNVSDSLPDPSPDGTPPPSSNDPDYDPAPDAYSGETTAKKFWWLTIFVMAMCVLCVIIRADDKPWWMAPVMGAMFVFGAISLGYGDASWNYPIARGQRIQFIIVSLITAGVFTLLYFGAYQAGKRWPLRRKQSMEYRAHPRHQKKYP